MEEVKEYCVYGHFYNGVIFYIGSGAYYRNGILRSRAYDFINRSPKWKEFSEGNKDQVKVRVFLRTNNRQEAYDFEEKLTRRYFDHKAPLTNVNIGIHPSAETKRKQSLAQKGEKGNNWGKRGKDHPAYGKKLSEETLKRMSESKKGENNYWYGKATHNAKKVLIVNNGTGESKVFDSIKRAYKFIVERGYSRSENTFYVNIIKGPYNFENYTMELA